MKIAIIGAGPSGLYFAISIKLKKPECEVEVFERNKPDDTFGWGVVFSDQTLGNLEANDPKSAEEIANNFSHWDDIDVHFKGEVLTSSGHGFIGIGRLRLLEILQARALELGVKIHFETEVEVSDLDGKLAGFDLIIASDGINSKIREAYPKEFEVDVDVRKNKFVWLGTHKVFEAFTFIFKETEHGLVWAHAYRFDKETSTFIVECSEKTWKAHGFDKQTQEDTSAVFQEMFADFLDGNDLLSNAKHLRGSAWLNFRRIICEQWSHKNIILLGDAAHTAHFSIGSGTKLGFEDAIKLAEVLTTSSLPLKEALSQYQEERHLEVIKIQSAARNSTEWFEHLHWYMDFEPLQFAYSLLTRSQRVSHENLRLRDKVWLEGVEKWFAGKAIGKISNEAVPPMFTPFKLREMELKNRVVVSPMCMYSAKDGLVNDFHFIHLTSRAMGGAGLVYTEMTDVSSEARITPGCAGLYNDEHVKAWKRIVDFIHENTDAKMTIQLAHAGPKGSTKIGWEGYDVPLDSGNWPLVGPSPIAWDEPNQVPLEMTREDMAGIQEDFVAATKRAIDCGFDMLELHAAHGYLLSSFITPISNKRNDEYGGNLENRLRFPLEVFTAMRAVWPSAKPMSVRISASDWVDEAGITGDEAVEIARAFEDAGADIIDVSAGQTSTEANPIYGRMFQTPLSDQIRNNLKCATIAVGNIFEVDHVNSIIMAGRADLCALARPHLMDPYWTHRAAAELGYGGSEVPKQYTAGFDQLERLLERQREMNKA
ncbi:MAG: bifunctional salicylyl-CoA 5-hydroxylase/oxidoreductase [Sphingomonadales bacterium]